MGYISQWKVAMERSFAQTQCLFSIGASIGQSNKRGKKRTLRQCNAIIVQYRKHEDMKLALKTLRGRYELEIYGDSASKEYNRQGLVVLIRPEGREYVKVAG